MKRVLCLYRVSTKGQVDPKDDLPMQRRECLEFIKRMPDWIYYDERLEKVSQATRFLLLNAMSFLKSRRLQKKSALMYSWFSCLIV